MIDCGEFREPYVIQEGDDGEIIEDRLGLPRGSLANAPRYDEHGNVAPANWAVGQTICVPNALSIELSNERLISEQPSADSGATSQAEPQSEAEGTAQSVTESDSSANTVTITVSLEAVPSLWAMVSVDDLYRYLWVTEWGLDLASYNYEQAELLFAGELIDDLPETEFGGEPPESYQLPNATINDLNEPMSADLYLQYMWYDVWGMPYGSYDSAQAQSHFLVVYGIPVTHVEFIEDADSLAPPPELQTLLDSPFAPIFLGTNGNVDQSQLTSLISEYGMDAFLDYYELVTSSGAFNPQASTNDFLQAYDYLRAVEDGEEPPFEPWFDPNSTTDDALYGSGTLLNYGEGGNTDEAIASWMLGRVAQMLALMPEFEGISLQDIEDEVARMIPIGASPEQVAEFVNDIAFDIGNLYANNVNPDINYYEANQIAQGLLTDSAVFLRYRQIDEARQIVEAWDYETAANTLNTLRGTVGSIQALPASILTVSTEGAKAEFAGILAGLEGWYNQMDVFRQQIPFIENEALLSREAMEQQLADGDNLFWLAMGVTVGMVFEPADWAISFFEYLDTGDPSVLLLAAIPLVPGAAARAARVARSLPEVARTIPDTASAVWRFLGDLDYTSVLSVPIPLPPNFFVSLLDVIKRNLNISMALRAEGIDVDDFLTALHSYTTNKYELLGGIQRGEVTLDSWLAAGLPAEDFHMYVDQINIIERGLSVLPGFEGGTIYRGIQLRTGTLDEFRATFITDNGLVEGAIIQSDTLDGFTRDINYRGVQNRNVIIQINNNRSGVNIASLSTEPGEFEVLIPSGTSFRVVEIIENPVDSPFGSNTLFVIILEEINE